MKCYKSQGDINCPTTSHNKIPGKIILYTCAQSLEIYCKKEKDNIKITNVYKEKHSLKNGNTTLPDCLHDLISQEKLKYSSQRKILRYNWDGPSAVA